MEENKDNIVEFPQPEVQEAKDEKLELIQRFRNMRDATRAEVEEKRAGLFLEVEKKNWGNAATALNKLNVLITALQYVDVEVRKLEEAKRQDDLANNPELAAQREEEIKRREAEILAEMNINSGETAQEEKPGFFRRMFQR